MISDRRCVVYVSTPWIIGSGGIGEEITMGLSH